MWRARDDEQGHVVAIKALHSSLAEDAIRRERFLRGAQRMAGLDHHGVVRVIEPHGEDGGFHFFVMEFVDVGFRCVRGWQQAQAAKSLPVPPGR
ncbi:hypothetical protein WMF29_19885 [Sorangium sp. So ce381]